MAIGHSSGKYKMPKPVGGTQFGTTITDSDPAKFPNKGKASGKTKADPVSQSTGPVFTENSSHISMPNADKAAKMSKQISARDSTVNISQHKTVAQRTASQSGSGEPTTPAYALKKSYEKSGKTSARSAKAER